MQAVGNSLTVLGVMLLTFIVTVTLIGELQFSRDQKTMYDNFRGALANATAPVSQLTATGGLVPLGTPMALLKFPSVTNQTFVVVEGTTSDVLMAGPGHRRDTVLPGQGGLSVIFGRRALFGGPFNAVTELKVGDKIIATTGQGRSVYVVSQIRHAGVKQQPTKAAGRLTLMTAAGSKYVPDGIYYVDADLASAATDENAVRLRQILGKLFGDAEQPFAPVHFLPDILRCHAERHPQHCKVVDEVGAFPHHVKQGRLVAWVIGLPVLLAIGVALSDQIAGLLPNLM